MALGILRDILPGKDYGVKEEEFKEVIAQLSKLERSLFKSYDLSDGTTLG